jgi:hypothetical protein
MLISSAASCVVRLGSFEGLIDERLPYLVHPSAGKAVVPCVPRNT